MTNTIENQNELETRKLELEARAVLTSANPGQITIYPKMSEQILHIAKRKANVFSRTDIYLANGRSELPVNLTNIKAMLTPEMGDLVESVMTIKRVKFFQKRFGHASLLSQQAINDSAIPLTTFIPNELAVGNMQGLQDSMFYSGDAEGNVGLQNIILHNKATINKIEDMEIVNDAPTVAMTHDHLWEGYIKLAKQPGGLDGAVVVVEDFEKLAKIKNPDTGKSVVDFVGVEPGSSGTVFGLQVFEVEEFAKVPTDTEGVFETVGAVFMNPKSYKSPVGNGSAENTLVAPVPVDGIAVISGDTTTALSGSVLYLGQLYADGKVFNPRHFKLVKTI